MSIELFHFFRFFLFRFVVFRLILNSGEEPNEYNFTRIKLNWGGLSYSPYATYGNAISLAGTMFMIGGLSKLFHLTDPLVGLLGTVFSSASKVMNVSLI